MDPKWLNWAKRLQALSQNGLTYARDTFDIERYESIKNIAAEIMSENSDLDMETISNFFSREEGYATPKVDVRGVVFRENCILLVKERADNGWTLPGGWADTCQSPSENVVREVYEESGFKTKTVKLLAVYDRSRHPHEPPFPYHIYKMFFLCEIIGGTARKSAETTDVDFFPEDRIPPLSISRVLPKQISRMFKHYYNPNLPSDFD